MQWFINEEGKVELFDDRAEEDDSDNLPEEIVDQLRSLAKRYHEASQRNQLEEMINSLQEVVFISSTQIGELLQDDVREMFAAMLNSLAE